MKDFMSTTDDDIRDQTLNTNATHPNQAFNEIEALMSIDECHDELEEAHYHHVINDFVELIVLYGQDKVMHDLKLAIGWKKT